MMEERKLPLTISDKALQKIIAIKRERNIGEEYFLRLGVKPAGCGISSFVIGFDHQEDIDDIFQVNDIKIIISKKQLLYLAGKKIDYVSHEEGTGFVFLDKA